MKTNQLLFLLSATLCTPALAQKSKLNYTVEAQAIGTTNEVVPFWMRSNQFGSIPSHGASASFVGRAIKEYDSTKTGLLDWGAGFEGRANAGKNSGLLLIEGYAKVKAGIFQLKAGRTKDIMGLNGDSSLTSGNFSLSGNALGIPTIELSIVDYYRLPILSGLIAVKGNFSHGWVGNKKIRDVLGTDANTGRPFLSYTEKANTFLHQKSLYGRIGKENWKANFYGGFNHQVYWGNEDNIFGPNFDLSKMQTLFYVATGKAYGNRDIARSKIGNHIGSIDVGVEYSFDRLKVLAYRQNFYETGGLAKLANIKDGLTGISIENTNQNFSSPVRWKKLLFEFLYTKHQAGERNSRATNSGDEDYYNNYIYENGWFYKGNGLGTPLITSRDYLQEGLINDPKDYFFNNRIIAFHFGAEASIYSWTHLIKLTYSSNYGTFATSEEGRSTGNINFPPRYGLFGNKKQISGYLKGHRSFSNTTRFGYAIAFDQGELLNNTFGAQLSVAKSF